MTSGKVLAGCEAQVFYLRLTGDVRLPWCVTLENYASAVLQDKHIKAMVIDLSHAANLDSTTLGILAKIGQAARKLTGDKPDVYLRDAGIARLLQSMGFDALFTVHDAAPPVSPKLPVLPIGENAEGEIQDSVIGAHKTLMGMNRKNTRQFENLVENLERAREGEPPVAPKK